MVTVVLELGLCVLTVNEALVAPAATVTVAGMLATLALLLESETAAPPAGAAPLSVTVPVDELPPRTLVGFSASDESETADAPPQTFGVPPPPQVCGAVQEPQLKVPPQPSGMLPQLSPWAAQVVGVQPLLAVTVRVAFCVSPKEAEMVA